MKMTVSKVCPFCNDEYSLVGYKQVKSNRSCCRKKECVTKLYQKSQVGRGQDPRCRFRIGKDLESCSESYKYVIKSGKYQKNSNKMMKDKKHLDSWVESIIRKVEYRESAKWEDSL